MIFGFRCGDVTEDVSNTNSSSFFYLHLFNYNTTTVLKNKKEVKTNLTIH